MAGILSSPSGIRKRPSNPNLWKRNVMKKARTSGIEYKSIYTGKVVAARSLGQPCNCDKNCFTAIGEDNMKTIHLDYWHLANQDLQTSFLQSHIVDVAIKRRYTQDQGKFRSCQRLYHLTVNGTKVVVCKTAFANILGIGRNRIDHAYKSKTPSACLIPDQRGKNEKKKRISQEKMQLVKSHINSIPVTGSHYRRSDLSNAKYIEASVTSKRQLYEFYKVSHNYHFKFKFFFF